MIKHISVLPMETIKYLAPQKNQNFIDATCGLGGHTELILAKTGPKGRVLAIDQDEEAIEQARKNLKNYLNRVDLIKSNFSNLGLLIRKWSVEKIDGILFDLGVSSYQLDEPTRGFSFTKSAVLDMRMSKDARLSAKEIVNSWDEVKLRKIIQEYGEEPFASKIAKQIVKTRQAKPIITTDELVEIIKRALPPVVRYKKDKHFATATFRALRMAVNDELPVLQSGLKQAGQIISPGGKIVVISFHSLEDRIVKQYFLKSLTNNENLQILTKKPIIATKSEIKLNPRARSAKLRAAIKEE